ncbi:hypothetical protein J4414_02165, partial [Candidatus Woesearchaeota archaeon]|nr:hypothetical protein [Candidatus Woesearchaeota archaeon]
YEVKECEPAGGIETKKEETPTTTPSTTIEEKNGKIGYSLKLSLGELKKINPEDQPQSDWWYVETDTKSMKNVYFKPLISETNFCSTDTIEECEGEAKEYKDDETTRKAVLQRTVNTYCIKIKAADFKACQEEQMKIYLADYTAYVFSTNCQKTCCPGDEISCTINAPM